MKKTIDLCELLYERGLPKQKMVTKLVRHQDTDWSISELIARNQLDHYQSNQSRPIFRKCQFVVSFMGERHSFARLLGVYRVVGVTESDNKKWPRDFLYPAMKPGRYWYSLEKLPAFEALEKRVIIDWGKSPRMWHQWLSPREVVEIRPTGHAQEFPGLDNVLLSFRELCEIIANPSANREWHRALSSVFGIYLITCASDGHQYVGSAYGEGGILGRWKNYAATGHGGNIRLKPRDPDEFRFSILRMLPTDSRPEEVIAVERTYMKKLGSRAHGLNS
jgi:GIY-YIG catalytic domain